MSNERDDLETIPELELSGGVRGKYYGRYMRGTDQRGPAWQVETSAPFWDSLKALPDTDAVGSTLAGLLHSIITQPQAAPVVEGTRVQIATSPETSVAGERVAAFILLYVLTHSSNLIRLLTVQLAESSSQVPPHIAAQLRPLIGDADPGSQSD